MTTTTERLLALADEHERKAIALRLAAHELNGHQTTSKQAHMNGTVEQAIQLDATRRAQRVPKKQRKPHKLRRIQAGSEEDQQRLALIRRYLEGGPRSTPEISAHLAAHGVELRRDGVRKQLKRISHVKLSGVRGKGARWQLGARASQRRARPAGKPFPERDERARIVAQILKDAGRPLPIKELSAAARAQGITHLTAIYNYVQQGYLKRTGSRKGQFRYAFKAMPPERDATAST